MQDLIGAVAGLSPKERKALAVLLKQKGINLFSVAPIFKRQAEEAVLLSYAQERQWFLWQLDPDSAAYHMSMALRLQGSLDVAALQRSLTTLVARHETLRTTFSDEADQQLQVIAPPSAFSIAHQTLTPPADCSAAALKALVQAQTRQLFDLRQGPLLRVTLVKLGEDEHVLILTQHHIVSDGWSLQILLKELIQLYQGYSECREVTLPALPVQYADYALWQRQWMDSGERERQLGYWLGLLAGAQPLLELPLDHPRPPQQSFAGARHAIPLSPACGQALKQLAQREGVTPFMLLLATFQALLHRYSGQQDIRVGVPTANRNRAETEHLIGFFVNTQVLKAEVDPQQSFRALLKQVRQRVLEAQEHQDLPYEQLVEALQPERSLSHNPLFQVMFNHQSEGPRAQPLQQLSHLTLEALAWDNTSAQFDLTLDTFETEDGLAASLTYATDLFEAPTIARMAQHWQNLLNAVVADAEQRIAELALFDATEQQAMLDEWNPQARQFAGTPCIHRQIEAQAERHPQAIAVAFEAQQLSYQALNQRANQLAHVLIEQGVVPDVLVGLAVQRGLDMVVGLLAILKAGGAYVPLDPSYPQDRLAYMMQDSGISLLLTESALLAQLPIPAGVQTLLLDQFAGDPRLHNPDVAVQPSNLAYVIYTSGSTGKPKGTLLPHSNVLRLFQATDDWFDFGTDDVWSLFHSYAFDFSVWEIFGALLHGGKLLIVPHDTSRSPEDFHALLCREGVTVLNQTPSAFKPLMQVACAASQQASALRYVVFGGEALDVKSLRPWFERFGDSAPQLINMYGITETTVHVTYRPLSLADLQQVASSPIGAPIPDLSWYLLDGALNPVAKGCVGELYVGRAGLARGYLKRGDLTATRFIPDPFSNGGERLYRTGDLARYRTDGVIEYVGRIDHQVKIRGFRIELGEIEAQLLAQPGVGTAVVLAQASASGQQLVAYVVATEALDAQHLKAQLREHLPDYMVPTHVLFLDQLPLTGNGKLDRKALPQADASQNLQAYVAPQSVLEQQIAAIWQDVLKLEQVGLTDNFFELGGDSIISIQVVSRARQAGIRFTPKELFQHQTVQGLASVAQTGEGGVQIDQGPVSGSAPLLPIHQVFFDTEIAERHHWNQSVLLKPSQPLQAEVLEQALQALVSHHDALRLSFREGANGWSASFVQRLDQPLLWLREITEPAALEPLAEAAQRSLDLVHGPLLRALLTRLPSGEQRLLLVIHHLAVDGVSWRILFEDLQSAYNQLLGGNTPKLPLKTSSVKAWAEQLQAYARSEALQQELAYWQAQLAQAPLDLPCVDPHASLDGQHAAIARTELSKAHTAQLLQDAPAAYRTQVNDLLLTALARVITRWTGEASVLLQMEGHGREELFDSIDLVRTVGWFTSLFPVCLTPASSLDGSIKQVKEQLRSLPNKGIGYGALRYLGDAPAQRSLAALPVPRITFNYLGQFDGSFAQEDALFAPANEYAGREQGIDAPLGNWLSLNGKVYDGVLSMTWSFSQAMFDPAQIQALADDYRQELETLIAHCLDPQHSGVTASDFPLARLNQVQLDSLPFAAATIADLYPLSAMQQGMLFHALYEQGRGQYINQMQLEVEGLDPERFRQAWQAAMDAHDILRTGFHWQGDLEQPVQWVLKQVEVPFSLYDWRAEHDLAQAVQALADGERARGFDLAQAPLLRLCLVRIGDNRHHLIYTSHHILMDGWSNSQLLGEVLQRYNGQPPAHQVGRYQDYIAWLQRQDAQRTQAFWLEQVRALQAPTRLAKVYAHTPEPGHGEHFHVLDAAATQHLSEFARQQKVTLNTLVQAAWLLLLQRYTGQATVSFGATVSGRPAELRGVEQQIGLFINTLPVIASPLPQQSVASWLQQLQAQNLSLREFEHTPLFEVQRWAGQGGEALFDNILVFENYPIAEALEQEAPDDLRFGSIESREQTNYPLTVLVAVGASLSLQFSFARAHFSQGLIEQLARHLGQLLGAMAELPEAALGTLRLLGEQEHRQQMLDWNTLTLAPPAGASVHQLIEARVERMPAAPALLFAATQLSYAELNAHANRLAHALIERGVGPEVRVGMAAERGVEMVVGLLAVLKAGGAYVPLDPEYPQERLSYMIEDSGIALLLTQRHLNLAVPTHVQALMLDELDLSRYAPDNPLTSVNPDNLSHVIYTSGSTGKPKGVAIAHRNVLALVQWTQQVYSADDLQGVLASTSICFDLSVWELFVTLACGGSIVLARNALALPELAARDAVRLINTVPSAINALQRSNAIPASVRIINLAGEPLKQSLVDTLYAAPTIAHVYDLYGPSEDTTYSTWTRREPQGRANIGRPIGHTASYVLDGQLQVVPVGVAAELYLAGEGLARGYLLRPGLTAEKFVPNPYSQTGERMYRTGDLTRYRADGVLEYAGRIDHQVKIRGFRIELGEIEARLLAVPAVSEAAVVAVEAAHGQQLVAYVAAGQAVLGEQAQVLREQLKAALAEHLPDYMVPSQWLFLERLPLTPNGKLDRKALPAPDASQQRHAYVAPQGELEQQLAAIWQAVLGIARIGRDDHFFELGGHSLLVVNVVSRIQLELGMKLTPQLLFQFPTLAAFAHQLTEQGGPVETSTLSKLECLLDEMEDM